MNKQRELSVAEALCGENIIGHWAIGGNERALSGRE